jgi:hypothetical protein
VTGLTPDHEAAIMRRHALATSGTWYLQPNHGPHFVASEQAGYEHGIGDLDFGVGDQADADREFVLNAHADMLHLLAEVDRLREQVAALETYAHGCDGEGCVLPHSSWCQRAKAFAAEHDGCTCGRPWEGTPQPHSGHCWLLSPPQPGLDRARAEISQLRTELTRRRTEDLNLRGTLAPADRPRRVPMPLGETLVPAVEWLLAELDQACGQLDNVALVKVWRNEDGREFLFADDIRHAAGVPTRDTDTPGIAACHSNRHCVTWGFCHRCAPDLSAQAMRRLHESPDGERATTYAAIVDELAKARCGCYPDPADHETDCPDAAVSDPTTTP